MPVTPSRSSGDRGGDEGPDRVEAGEVAPESAPRTQRSPEEIARRAYERYEARGREDGRDQEDLFEAERDLNGQTTE